MIACRTASGQFNLRVAGVAVAHGCVLIHRMAGDDFWTLPGGRPEMMEPAAAALRREMREETGLAVEVGRALCVAENFFTYRGTPFHELLLCFDMHVPVTPDAADSRFPGHEGHIDLEFWWCPLDRLDQNSVHPVFLGELVRDAPATCVHVVQDDRRTGC